VEDQESLVRFIEQRLECSVLYTSSGPTYLDKTNLRPETVRPPAARAGVSETPFALPQQIAG